MYMILPINYFLAKTDGSPSERSHHRLPPGPPEWNEMLKIVRNPLGFLLFLFKHSGLILGSPSLDPEASPSLSRDASAGPEAMEIDVHGNAFFVYDMDFLCSNTKKPAHFGINIAFHAR